MKRDMDLIRAILLDAEGRTSPPRLAVAQSTRIEGYDDATIVEHIRMLVDARMVEAHVIETRASSDWRIERLTWKGHDFLAAARDETDWKKAKTKLGSSLGSATLSILKEVLVQIVKERVLGVPGPR
jgi:Hypothetical protein (DUF2513)